MDDEEWRKLQAKFGPVDTAEADQAQVAEEVTDEEFSNLEMKFGAVAAPAPAPEAPPEATLWEKTKHVGKGFGQALVDVVELPYNLEQLADSGLKWAGVEGGLPGETSTRPITDVIPGAQVLKQAIASEEANVPKGSGADLLRTAAEWGGAGPVNAIRKGLIKALPDVAIGTTAATGQAAGDWLSGEEGGEIGELIGGMLGVAAAWKTGKIEGLTSTQRNMLTKLQNQFTNPDEAIARLRERLTPEAGETEIGTLADLTRERNVANVEAMIAGTSEGAQAFPRTLEARSAQIYKETMAPLRSEGTHAEVGTQEARAQISRDKVGLEQATNRVIAEAEGEGTVLRKALNQEAAQATQEAATARAAAKQAEGVAADTKVAVDPGARPDQYSTSVTGKYTAAEKDHRAITQELYDEFDAGPDIVAAPFKGAAAEFLSEMDPAEAAALTEKYGKYFKIIDEFEPTVSPRGLSLRIQQMKADVNNAHQNGTAGFEEGKLKEFYTKLEDALAQPNVSQRYAEAVSSYKEGSDRFGPGYIKGLRKTAEPEELLSQIGLQGDRGAASARLLEESKIPELQDDVGDYVRAQAVRAKNLDEGFLVQYEAVLDNLPPTVREDIVGLVEARTTQQATKGLAKAADSAAAATAKRTGKEQARLDKSVAAEVKSQKRTQDNALDAMDSDVRGQYAKGFEEADRLVDDMLTKPDGPDQLRDLMEQLEDVGGDAVDSLKTRVAERIDNQLFDIFTATGGESRQAVSASLKKFRDMRRRLTDNDLLGGADADYIDSVLERTQSEILRKGASARVGNLARSDSDKSNLFASFLSAILLAPLPGGYNLQLGGAVRRNFKNVLEAEPTKKNIKALTEYLNNPQQFLEGLDKLKDSADLTSAFLTRLVGASQAAEILGGE